jgi:hypothetical protein
MKVHRVEKGERAAYVIKAGRVRKEQSKEKAV